MSVLLCFSPSFHSPTISLCWVLLGFSLNPLVPPHPAGDGVVVVGVFCLNVYEVFGVK
jgi:hypothetical protein